MNIENSGAILLQQLEIIYQSHFIGWQRIWVYKE